VAALALSLSLPLVVGCGGHEARTLKMRTALDEGRPREAIAAIDEELDVGSPAELPKALDGDNALLVLDRASIQQSLAEFARSEADYQAADKAIDMLDISHNAADTLGKYVFSDDVGRYQAPPYEKLLINTLNMVNYLEQGDLDGARVEARRLAVIHTYFKDTLKDAGSPVLGLGGFLAGLTYERSGEIDEALRWYDTALAYPGFSSLRESVRALLPLGAYRSPRLRALEAELPLRDESGAGAPTSSSPNANANARADGEIVILVGYGRVPHKIAKRLPIGLALTYFAGAIRPDDAAAANQLAVQGLVTWVNYPSLAPEQGNYETPLVTLDRSTRPLVTAVDVSAEVRRAWSKLEGPIVASAISRMVVRAVAGEGIRRAGGGSGTAGVIALLASIGTQATLTALDTPDTRSWETLPARIAIARVRVPAGKHTVHLEARGVSRVQPIDVPANGLRVVSLMALR
jgi:tetratricopeptide (TPR) repeat protein